MYNVSDKCVSLNSVERMMLQGPPGGGLLQVYIHVLDLLMYMYMKQTGRI